MSKGPGPDSPMDLLEVFKDSEDIVDVPAGSVIIREGDEGNKMFVVMDGEVEITIKGKRIATAARGEIVGEMALISPKAALIRYGITFIVPPVAGLVAHAIGKL